MAKKLKGRSLNKSCSKEQTEKRPIYEFVIFGSPGETMSTSMVTLYGPSNDDIPLDEMVYAEFITFLADAGIIEDFEFTKRMPFQLPDLPLDIQARLNARDGAKG